MPKDMSFGTVIRLNKSGSHILTSSTAVQSCKFHMNQILINRGLTLTLKSHIVQKHCHETCITGRQNVQFCVGNNFLQA